MNRRSVLLAPLLMASSGRARANVADGYPRLEKLYPMFIAPCCWRENLMVHHSPKATELRAEIVALVGEGKTDDEIKAYMLERYSTRILSLPEGTRGSWLQWTPRVLAVTGAGVVAWVIKRSLANHRQQPPPAAPTGKLPDLPESEWT
ncbi:MAG: cytochrome c-type biogenesis protein CcmH [Bryobacterales bacterium]|nr:cytochrome c-type biogenesis protein CcmH [Bryobacterales bacterium]